MEVRGSKILIIASSISIKCARNDFSLVVGGVRVSGHKVYRKLYFDVNLIFLIQVQRKVTLLTNAPDQKFSENDLIIVSQSHWMNDMNGSKNLLIDALLIGAFFS